MLWEVASIYDRPNLVTLVSIIGFVGNIVLNKVLIFGTSMTPAYGIAGAATSTVLISLIMVALLGYLMRAEFKSIIQKQFFGASSVSTVWQIFKLGFPIGLTELATVGFFASSTFLVGKIGVDLLAAHAITFQVTELAVVFVIGFGLLVVMLYHILS
jgi:multidrug resistance protein, MATE family